jgi:hypothetical protein
VLDLIMHTIVVTFLDGQSVTRIYPLRTAVPLFGFNTRLVLMVCVPVVSLPCILTSVIPTKGRNETSRPQAIIELIVPASYLRNRDHRFKSFINISRQTHNKRYERGKWEVD